jgi:hypothetical protein
MAELLARLDHKTRLRVLCGSIGNTCRGDLARVAIMEKTAVAFEGRTLVPGDRVLCMLDGWRQQGHATGPRHWVEIKTALERAASAVSAVRRGVLDREQLAGRRPRNRRPITRLGGFDSNADVYGFTGDNYVILPGPEGVLVDCPLCRRTNTLTADRLRVVQR